MPRIISTMAVWNGAGWLPYNLRWMYPVFDDIYIVEANWTSDDPRWGSDTSPDGTADIIRGYPDPEHKIHLLQMGRIHVPRTPIAGYSTALHTLFRQIEKADWVWEVCSDEFYPQSLIDTVVREIPEFDRRGYTTIGIPSRNFYYDFTHHTEEHACRIRKWAKGFTHWGPCYTYPKELNLSDGYQYEQAKMGLELFHYSYVPLQGAEIKACMVDDVQDPNRYRDWYRNTLSKYDGTNLEEVYATNQGGVHVFGGLPLLRYYGEHPSILSTHPLRTARWWKGKYEDETGAELEAQGWW